MIVTDRPTDSPRYLVCNNGPHLRNTAMQPQKAIHTYNNMTVRYEIQNIRHVGVRATQLRRFKIALSYTVRWWLYCDCISFSLDAVGL